MKIIFGALVYVIWFSSFAQPVVPEQLKGFWSCDCVVDKNAQDEASKPPAFVLKDSPKGPELWHARTQGKVTKILTNGSSYTLYYRDKYEGEIQLKLLLKGTRLIVDGGYEECKSGMQKCKIPSNKETCYF
jgi:hypothetical protein